MLCVQYVRMHVGVRKYVCSMCVYTQYIQVQSIWSMIHNSMSSCACTMFVLCTSRTKYQQPNIEYMS